MPVVVEFTEAVITLRLIGEYSHDDMRDAFLTGMGSPATTVGGLLIDVRQSLSLRNRPAAEVRSMSRWWTLRAQRFARRMALVADPGTLEHGMARLSYPEIPVAALVVRVFGDEGAARAWLADQQCFDNSQPSSA